MSMYLCASIQRREPRCRTWRGCRKNLAEFSVAEPTWSSAAPSNRAGITFVEKQFLNQPSASMRRDDACLLDMLLVPCQTDTFASERAGRVNARRRPHGILPVLPRAATPQWRAPPAPEGRGPHGLWPRCAPGQWEAPFPAGRALPHTMGNALMRRYLFDTALAARDAVAFAGELTLWKFRQSRLHQNAILKSIDIVGEAAARVGIWPASRLTRVHMPLAYCSPASIATGRRFRRVGNGQVAKSVKAQGGFWALLKSTIVIPSGPGAYAYRYRPAG